MPPERLGYPEPEAPLTSTSEPGPATDSNVTGKR
jgi:hypothetical protein